jgi:hypothetical protein
MNDTQIVIVTDKACSEEGGLLFLPRGDMAMGMEDKGCSLSLRQSMSDSLHRKVTSYRPSLHHIR